MMEKATARKEKKEREGNGNERKERKERNKGKKRKRKSDVQWVSGVRRESSAIQGLGFFMLQVV